MFMTANTHFSTTGKAPTGGPERIPFGERLTCSVDDATKVSGLSRSMVYNKMKSGEIEWTKIGARRLIKVPSLLRFLGVGCPFVDDTTRGA
jgi:predicted DNA-binding transcriptional regulator AlpA